MLLHSTQRRTVSGLNATGQPYPVSHVVEDKSLLAAIATPRTVLFGAPRGHKLPVGGECGAPVVFLVRANRLVFAPPVSTPQGHDLCWFDAVKNNCRERRRCG